MDTTTTLTAAMKRTRQVLQGWWDDESGVTAIEYGLLAALIAVACIAAFTSTGVSLGDMYDKWSQAVIAAVNKI